MYGTPSKSFVKIRAPLPQKCSVLSEYSQLTRLSGLGLSWVSLRFAALLLEKDWRPEMVWGWNESVEAGGRVTREGRQGVGCSEARLTGSEENICCCSEVNWVRGGGK